MHNLFTIAMSKSQGITKKNGTPNIHTCQAHTNTVQSRNSHSTLYNCNFSTSTLHKLAGGPQNNLWYTKNTSEIHTCQACTNTVQSRQPLSIVHCTIFQCPLYTSLLVDLRITYGIPKIPVRYTRQARTNTVQSRQPFSIVHCTIFQ